MKITLIDKETFIELAKLQRDFPKLTYQARGYDEPNYKDFNEEEVKAFKRVSEILKGAIKGFRRFQNFTIDSKDNAKARFQYSYDEHFTGVGYIKLYELLNGFN